MKEVGVKLELESYIAGVQTVYFLLLLLFVVGIGVGVVVIVLIVAFVFIKNIVKVAIIVDYERDRLPRTSSL